MTDYLEQLLEEQEEEQHTWEWNRPATHRNGEVAQRGSLSRTEGSVAEREEQAGADLAARIRAVREQEGTQLMPREEDRMELLSRQTGRLRRAVEQMHSQTRRSVLGETDMGPGRDSRIPGTAGAVPRAADYAALVDAAFARDARRYDGPLCLL